MPQSLPVGRLGVLAFEPGCYAYVGSAMGGLKRRLTRYLKQIERPHWHVDALCSAFRLTAIWVFPSADRQECRIARLLMREPGLTPVPHFGCTDCRCFSHLFYMSEKEKAPLFEKLKGALRCRDARVLTYS